jgi:hypothetical protein
MKSALNTVLIITAAIAIVFGLGFVLVPSTLWALYGVKLNTAGMYLAQLFGTANIGIGLVIVSVRGASAPDIGRRLAMGILGWVIVEGIIVLLGQLQGITNVLGWLFVALDLILAVAYAYFLLTGSASARRTASGQLGEIRN